MRVFVGPVEIAGYYGRLAEGLRSIGVDAVAIDITAHRFGYAAAERPPFWVRAATGVERRWIRSRALPKPLRVPLAAVRVATRLGLLAWSLTRFDAFIFGYGTTMLFSRELALLRLLRKRMVFVFNGSDARPPYIDGADMAPSRGLTIDDCIALAARKKALIRRVERYADAVVAMPTYSHFFKKPVVDYLRVGTPIAAAETATRDEHDGGEIRVLHSPSDPQAKGSENIREAVEALRRTGHSVRMIELTEVPNEAVRNEIERADLVIDQLYADTPMAVFATEAAAAGVPAVVGSYAWDFLGELYLGDEMPPVEACEPDELAAAVERLLDGGHRSALGARARTFVAERWAPAEVAKRYVTLLDGETRREWQFDPASLRYLRGAAMPEARAREIVAAVIERGGRAALALADKPDLERAFVEFAARRPPDERGILPE